MKKKISLFISLYLLFTLFITHVNAAAVECGYRYLVSHGGYVMFYKHGEYCAPYSKILAEERGIKDYNGWNTTAYEVDCDDEQCVYYYNDKGKINSLGCTSGCYEAKAADKDKTLSHKYNGNSVICTNKCVTAWYSQKKGDKYYVVKYKDAFTTVNGGDKKGACLIKKKGDKKYIFLENGVRYAQDEYGYTLKTYVDNAEECSNLETGNTGNTGDTGNTGSPSCSSNNLYSGCTGSSVQNLQIKLKAVQGCDIEIDGKYGPKTKECVKEFQKSNNLDVDGIAGSKTISALDEAYTKLQQGSSNTNELYYYITFDTNGGIFLNGETKRDVYYSESELTMEPATIPGKSGYKFLGWYSGNEKYTFGNKLTSNITLTAKYEKSTTTKYCLDGDVLDIDNNQCITVQEFDNQDKNKFYIINNKLLTIQTKFIYTRSCSSDGKYTVTYKTAEGSNNTVSCDSEKGYIRDTWRAEDNCQNDTTCPIKDGENSCQRIYRGTCYKSYDPGDTALGTEPDNTYNKDINNNATESPQTGGGIIALILITLSIIGLSIFCYKVYNQNNEEV